MSSGLRDNECTFWPALPSHADLPLFAKLLKAAQPGRGLKELSVCRGCPKLPPYLSTCVFLHDLPRYRARFYLMYAGKSGRERGNYASDASTCSRLG